MSMQLGRTAVEQTALGNTPQPRLDTIVRIIGPVTIARER